MGISVHRGAQSLAVSAEAEQPLALGDSIESVDDAHASLHTANGADVAIGPHTRVALAEIGESERIDLRSGAVSLDVAPLGPNRHFSVSTPNARVVVHGTAFSVRVLPRADGSTVTEVAVVRGKVGVSSGGAETLLLPGDHWSSDSRVETAAKTAEPAVAPAAPEAHTDVAKNPTKQPPKRPAVASIDPGALGEENQLFASALAASHRGDDRTAVTLLGDLLAQHPQSPLVPEARVERFRALKRLGDDDAAAREARRYLLEQHDGAARDEARDVALGAK